MHNDDQLDAFITHSLEAPPAIAVPSDFAARVMQSLPAKRAPEFVRVTRYGLKAVGAGTVVLFVLLVAVIVARPTNTFITLGVVPVLAFQLAALVFWYAVRRLRWR